MQITFLDRSLSFTQWKNLENAQCLFFDLIEQKNVSEIRKLNKKYKDYDSDNCTVLLGEMYNKLRSSTDVYDYDSQKKSILKKTRGKFAPLNNMNTTLVKVLYKEFQKLTNNKQK